MNAVYVILGFVLLITGLQLPWLFASGMGFLLANYFGVEPYLGLKGITLLLFSLGFGVIVGLLYIYFKRIVVVLAGFIAGAYICSYLPGALGWNAAWISLPVVLVAGLIAALIIFLWQSLALIFVSSLIGATLVIQFTRFPNISETFLFAIFSVVGILAQWVLMQYNRPDNE